MSEETTPKKPFHTHRDGRLSAAIWANDGEHGRIYNTTFAYSYQDKDGNWRDTQNIPAQELLKAANLAQTAYASVQRFKKHDRAQYVEQERAAADAPAPEHPRER